MENVGDVMVAALNSPHWAQRITSIARYIQDRCPGDKRGFVSSVATVSCVSHILGEIPREIFEYINEATL
jgi:hypothetical protein